MITLRLVTTIATLGLFLPTALPLAAHAEPTLATYQPAQQAGIQGSYLITLRSSEQLTAVVDQTTKLGGQIQQQYPRLGGFAAQLSDTQRDRLRRDSRIERIDQDQQVMMDRRIAEPSLRAKATSWGLDRIDQAKLPLDHSYTVPGKQGEGVHAYVLDSGIDRNHSEFTGRLGDGKDFVDNDDDPSDGFGHGTHVAGTIGGGTVGVAPKVTLHAVRVLDSNGNASGATVLAGLDWTLAHAQAPAVANMSVGGRANAAVDAAVKKLLAAGIVVVTAAGNDNRDACLDTPGRLAEVITVAATTEFDTRSWWSNWGKCVHIFAPGTDIVSAKMGGGTYAESGTSMAAPHVAGAVAIYQSLHPKATPQEVKKAILDHATADVRDPRGSPQRLLNVTFMNQ